ncbi:NADH dehydrogenase (ubiquinone) complex I, assembly factor 7-like protein [Cucumis melo var. makuwa]|uniref:Protein arginine methyltransferase NDUFAF7 n=1 Tax=Cucumis melo var. makuwa TaxID=1194695 RepID=A0A5D3D5T7_CUCMM|nr:NADH dehydrogenase (ubiquinone) complex I, assembly factor 7-like protein [Cucumis melo var. makuwa]
MASLALLSRNFSLFFHCTRVVSCQQPWSFLSGSLFSTHIVGDDPVLVRDFIHSTLYDQNHGYFAQRSRSVGVLEHSIKFNQLEGKNEKQSHKRMPLEKGFKLSRKAYMRYLDKIYKQSDVSWFTPVEIFKAIDSLPSVFRSLKRDRKLFLYHVSCERVGMPWYAHGIAEAIMRTANLSVPLKIYEIGGGSGTCAKGIMDYIMLNAPTRVYKNMTYTSVEISPSLAEIQRQTVGEVRSHQSKFKVECRDAVDLRGWGDVEEQPCWVIMLEVLDNLPHDLIYSENQVSSWMEVWVEKQLDSDSLEWIISFILTDHPFQDDKERESLVELYKPIQDPLIKRCVEIVNFKENDHTKNSVLSKAKGIWSKAFPKPRRSWLPTGCLSLLEVLHHVLPKMSLIASDFSYLPDVRIAGERAPLVSTKADGRSLDYESYLDAKGDADIFFPTDFLLLEQIDHYCSGWLKLHEDKKPKSGKKRRTIILDTSSFMEEFGLPSKTRLKDGYNPLLDDFKNTKFYLSVPTHNIK